MRFRCLILGLKNQHIRFLHDCVRAPMWCAGMLFAWSLQAADTPRYLIPKGQQQPTLNENSNGPNQSRTTYESLMEPRGTPKLMKDLHEQKLKELQEEERQKKSCYYLCQKTNIYMYILMQS